MTYNDERYFSIKIWREKTLPLFSELRALRSLRTGIRYDNVKLFHDVIEEALEREQELLRERMQDG